MAQRRVAVNSRMLAEARQRRRELDARRDEQDLRQEEAAAVVMEALADRDRAQTVLAAATRRVGDAVRALLAQEVTVERAAALLQIDPVEVRRLSKCGSENATRTAAFEQTPSSGTISSGTGAAGQRQAEIGRARSELG